MLRAIQLLVVLMLLASPLSEGWAAMQETRCALQPQPYMMQCDFDIQLMKIGMPTVFDFCEKAVVKYNDDTPPFLISVEPGIPPEGQIYVLILGGDGINTTIPLYLAISDEVVGHRNGADVWYAILFPKDHVEHVIRGTCYIDGLG